MLAHRGRVARAGRLPAVPDADVAPPDCAFCAIAAGSLPAAIVLDEPGAVGFLDVRPVFPGHVLLVPRAHVGTLPELPSDQLPVLFGAAQRLATAVVDALGADGTFVAINNRVSQSVPHLHVHVVPRRFKDGLRGFFWPRQKYEDDATMHDTAARIRAAL
jgi:histidine triad (HIT) family protein